MANFTDTIGTVGVREDLSNVLAMIDSKATVFSSMAKKEKALGNVKFSWQADQLEDASDVVAVDGSDVELDPSSNDYAADTPNKVQDGARKRVRFENNGSYLRRSTRVSTLHQDVNNVAAVANELARSVAKKTQELKRDLEKSMLSANDKQDDNGDVGYRTRGLDQWLTRTYSGDEAGYGPNSDAKVEVTYDSVNSQVGQLTEADVQTALQGIYQETGKPGSFDMLAGVALRRQFTNLVADSVRVANHPSVVRTVESKQDKTFESTIDLFTGDFGTIRCHSTLFGPSTNVAQIIDMDNVSIRFGIQPRSFALTNNGGGEARAVETFAGLCVYSPNAHGRIELATS